MKIIDLGICVNNVDPKGVGRIRCVRYNDYVGEKEKSINYTEWSDKDPFIASPFLPTNINFIPEVGQSVKIINYNTDKETINQEYIAGPFTTMYDYNSQTFTQQIEHTSYGVAVKHKSDIRDSGGNYDKRSENAFAKESDYGMYGKYGSDIILTENGLQLRGGKLKTKTSLAPSEREKGISYPIMSNNVATLYLKKFPKKATIKKQVVQKEVTTVGDLSTIIEYEIVQLTGTTDVNFYVYKVKSNYGQTFKTNFFSESTTLTNSGAINSVKLINTATGTTIQPTFVITGVSINDVHKVVRSTLHDLHDYGLNKVTSNTFANIQGVDDLHPFYYRPTEKFRVLIPSNSTELTNKNDIFNKIQFSNTIPTKSGLVWSTLQTIPPIKIVENVENVLVYENGSSEQTFSAIKSDRIYFISTDTNKIEGKSINFNNLNKYELTQEDYIDEIEPNTHPTVRGDVLYDFLTILYNTFLGHRHNLDDPYEKSFPLHNVLEKKFATLKNDMLNNSVKIN
jgi:hypothetical protein